MLRERGKFSCRKWHRFVLKDSGFTIQLGADEWVGTMFKGMMWIIIERLMVQWILCERVHLWDCSGRRICKIHLRLDCERLLLFDCDLDFILWSLICFRTSEGSCRLRRITKILMCTISFCHTHRKR